MNSPRLPPAILLMGPTASGKTAVAMALANVSGSMAGTWLALKRGSAFIRQVFLVVVGVLIVKFAWDTLTLL